MEKVAIVGGGIIGMTAAYILSKTGCAVTVIDRRDAGQATANAAGVLCPWLSQRRNKDWYRLAKNGARYYPELIQDLSADTGMPVGYKKTGALAIRLDRRQLDRLADKAGDRLAEAPEIGTVELLNPDQTRALVPVLAEGYGAVSVSGGARVDGRSLLNALMSGAVRHGAEIRHESAILHVTAGRVDGVVCASGTVIRAGRVVLAAGAWAKDALYPIGLRTDIYPQKGQLIHLTISGMDTGRWPVILPPGAHDLVPFDNGRLVTGSTHEDPEKGFDLRPTAGGISEILDDTLRFAPGLSDATIAAIRVGTRPFTPDFSPGIGPVPGHPELWMGNGLGSSGLTVGPLAGRLIAEAILGKKPMIPLEPFQPAKYIHPL